MRHDIYTLPEIMFVAGQSNIFRWRLFTANKRPFNADECVGNFAVVDYSNPNEGPLISKPISFLTEKDDPDIKNIAEVELSPGDTLGFDGKYIYQITIKDTDGKTEIPNQGFLQITHNINESFLGNY